MDPESLIQLLVDRELGGDLDSQELLAEFEDSGNEIFDFLEAAGFGGREDIFRFVAQEQGRDFVDLDNVFMPPVLLSSVDPEILRIFECLPLEVAETVAKVCVADPFDRVAIQELTAIIGKNVEVAVADPDKIRTILATIGTTRVATDPGRVVAASLGHVPDSEPPTQANRPSVGSPALLIALSVIAVSSMAFTALYLNQTRRLDAWSALVEKNESLLRQSDASRKGFESAVIQLQSDLGALEKLLTKKEVDAIRLDVFEKQLSELRGRMESLGKILAEVDTPDSQNVSPSPSPEVSP
ncbi:MAG: hypothetical protein ACKOB0_07140 [Chthoniobacterales bacterium]